MATTTQLTIEDFERLPAEEAKNHELVEGDLVPVPGNTLDHNRVQGLLHSRLFPLMGDGMVVSEQEYDFAGNAHGPDLSYFGPGKKALAEGTRRVQRFVPDLAIEIISQNDTFQALLRKKERYRACGVREVWILSIDTEGIFVYSDHGNRILKGSDVLETDLLPAFSTSIADLFAKV